ncbi:unnamed protein product [Brachionus calyciflorus]|uniref:MULE transposase domain-containing protein n=1 Tax=Brachionus calyciflorus TaxID=104777 RepID=A0A814AJ32_9BILA|nr:unnamed protein product [Brachionus calyciflorus]
MSKNVGDELDFIVVNVEHVDSSYDESKDEFILKERRRAIKTKASLPSFTVEPKSLEEIDIPDWLLVNIKNEDFLIYDSGKDDKERFFIFGPKNKLIQNNHVFCDGTFKVAPKLFLQMYTFHKLVEGCPVPVLFTLLPRKNQLIYERMLKAIKDNLELFPKSFNSDFKKAFLNAVKNIFPNYILYGCYFHFRKCMRSKIQE